MKSSPTIPINRHHQYNKTYPNISHEQQRILIKKKHPSSAKSFSEKYHEMHESNDGNESINFQHKQTKRQSNKSNYLKISNRLRSYKHNKNQSLINANKIKLSQTQKQIFALTPQLQQLSNKIEGSKNVAVQIKYVNTLKKVKLAAEKMNYKIKAKSCGIEIETTRRKNQNQVQDKQYVFQKVSNRYMKNKTMNKIEECYENAKSNNNKVMHGIEDINLMMRQNKKSLSYKQFTSRRMQTYMNEISTKNITIPFYCKYNIEKRLQNQNVSLLYPEAESETSNIEYQNMEQRQLNHFIQSPSRSPTNRFAITTTDKGSKNSTSSRWTALLKKYEEDIQQFIEICQFFNQIQNEMLKYLPNIHLHNKILNLIKQIKYSQPIQQIYSKCKMNINYFNPIIIVEYLKKNDGILSQMNYIVNIIKLNISAERRRRFKDVQKSIAVFQKCSKQTASNISQNISKIESSSIKSSILSTVNKIDLSCSGLKTRYLNYVNSIQNHQHSFQTTLNINSRRIICDILKFQALMK